MGVGAVLAILVAWRAGVGLRRGRKLTSGGTCVSHVVGGAAVQETVGLARKKRSEGPNLIGPEVEQDSRLEMLDGGRALLGKAKLQKGDERFLCVRSTNSTTVRYTTSMRAD